MGALAASRWRYTYLGLLGDFFATVFFLAGDLAFDLAGFARLLGGLGRPAVDFLAALGDLAFAAGLAALGDFAAGLAAFGDLAAGLGLFLGVAFLGAGL